MPKTDKRLWLVDFLRQLSIMLVLICHFYQAYQPESSNCFKRLALNGDVGVWIFFAISGFVIAKSTADRDGSLSRIDVRNFYVLRAARLLPLFIVVVVLGALGSHLCAKNAAQYSYVYGSGLETKNWLFWVAIFTSTFNWIRVLFDAAFGLQWDIFWSLSVEEQFYAIFPWLAGMKFAQNNLIWTLLLLSFAAPAGRWIFHHFLIGYYSGQNSFLALDLICSGILLHLFMERFEARLKTRQWLCHLLFSTGALIIWLVLIRDRTTSYDTVFLPSVLAAGVFMVLSGGLCIPWLQRLPSIFVNFGELSYGAYLLHPAILLASAPLLTKFNPSIGFPLFVLTTMFVARISFNYFERPMSKILRRVLQTHIWPTQTVNVPKNVYEVNKVAAAVGASD